MTIRELASRLEHVQPKANGGFTARCPAHDDQKNSLSVDEGQDGRVLVKCFAGCTTEAIVEAIELSMSDLFPDSGKRQSGTGKQAGKIEATYDFVDETGKLLYQEVRFEPKDFRLRRPNGKGGCVWHLDCNEKCKCDPKLPPVRRVLHNLPAILKADFLLVVEGPKDCKTAERLGFVATTNAMGARAPWLREYSESLRGKAVCLIGDADAPGVAHVREAARSLVGVAQSVKLIEALPGVPDKGDLTDYVQVGGTRESLLKLIDETPELTATDVVKWTAPARVPVLVGRIELVDSSDFLLRQSKAERPQLVAGLIPAGTHTQWQGRPKVGKSHTLLQLAYDAACGFKVFGKFEVPKAVKVCYVELEEPQSVTQMRFEGMIRAHGGKGPAAGQLRFFSRDDLYDSGLLSYELLTRGFEAFADAIVRNKVELVILIALRKLVPPGKSLKDPEVAEMVNAQLDSLRQRTGITLAVGHHDRKTPAETAEACGFGSTMISAEVDGIFDLHPRQDGLREVRFEGRFRVPDEQFCLELQKGEGEGELLEFRQWSEDGDRKANELRRRVASGESVTEAARALDIPVSTAYRWVKK